jgi:hypothetical protein
LTEVLVGQVTATVDFGTSHTVAVVSGPDLPARLVAVDGQPWFPSAVFWTGRGAAVVGVDALRMARTEPARLEPRPKSRIAEAEVLLGDVVVPTTTLVRAVLARVVAAASATVEAPVQHLVLTHPANWGSTRIGALLTAAQGLAPRLSTMSEPVAAAAWFAHQHEFPIGASIGVLDLGGGTCDAAVVRRERAGLSVVGCAGLPDLGGDDLDQHVVDRIRADEPAVADLLDRQQRLRPDEMAALLRFRDDVRAAKEVLSRHPQVDIALPAGLPDRLLTRQEFERLVSADLSRAVGLLTEVVAGCGLSPGDLHAVHLVGGSGQIPLLGHLLGAAFGTRVGLDEAPQSVVALGGHILTGADTGRPVDTEPVSAPDPVPTGPISTAPISTGPIPAAAPNRRPVWVAAAVVVVVALVAVMTATLGGDRTVPGEPRAEAAAAKSLSVPPPVNGDPITVPGQSTQHLPVTAKGTPVRYDAGGTTMTWRLDTFVDTPEQHAELAEAGVRTDGAHRLVLVRITVGAVDEAASPSQVEAETYVVDDRGLMISATENFRLSGCPERGGSVELEPGEQRQACLAFLVGRTAPVTEVVLSADSTLLPGKVTPVGPMPGARVLVTGKRVDGAAQPVPAAALRPLVPHTFRAEDGSYSADVAVADLVPEPSAYFDTEPIGLPGTRAVLARLAVRVPAESEMVPPLLVRLHDDRGTAIDRASTVDVTGQGCVEQHELDESTEIQLLCVLFAVPTATPVRDVEVSLYGVDPVVWAVS